MNYKNFVAVVIYLNLEYHFLKQYWEKKSF